VKRNIICVHAGEKYSNDYVEKLYRSCARNSTEDFIFTILHDGKSYNFNDKNVRHIRLESMNFLNYQNLWWYKLQAFRHDVAVAEQNLLLDLDMVIVNKIDKFWNYRNDKFVIDLDVVIVNNIDKLWDFSPGNFCIIQDFNRHWFPNYTRSNSSVVKFTPEIAENIFNAFMLNPYQYIKKFRGDQDYFDEYVVDKVWWPTKWAMSWKWEVFNGGMTESNSNKYYKTTTVIDEETSILVFHGKPDPHDVKEDIINLHWV